MTGDGREMDGLPAGPAPFRLTEAEFRAYAGRMGQRQAARLRQGHGPRATLILIAVLVILCAGLWGAGVVERRTALLVFILTLFAALVARLITYALFASAQARAAADAASDPSLFKAERRVTAAPAGLTVVTGRDSQTIPFAAIQHIETGEGLLYIWTGTAAAVVIPDRAFADAEQARAFESALRALLPAGR